jgi:uncharacterized membrane protein YjfL (UPF0719 family)
MKGNNSFFNISLITGCLTCFFLTYISVHPLVSVCFAVILIVTNCFGKYQFCKSNGDAEGMAQSGEDIYLMGYVFTLASLIGIAPSLADQNTDLFLIGGMKLCTTLVGMVCMIYMRQSAETIATTNQNTTVNRFLESEIKLNAAVERINHNAEKLTYKLSEMSQSLNADLVHSFSKVVKNNDTKHEQQDDKN